MGKQLKTYAQALGMQQTNIKEIDPYTVKMNTEKVGRKEKQSKREKDLQQIIGGMKKQIEKLQEVIKMVYNTIVQDKAVR